VRFLRTTISCVILAAVVLLHATHSVAAGLNFPLVPKWTTTLDVAPVFPPAFDATQAYVALGNGQLLSLSLEAGTSVWSVACTTTAAPAAGDSLVFTGGDGYVQALAHDDGARRWRTAVSGSVTSLYWDTGWLIATTDTSTLIAIRAIDGEVLWRRDLESALHSAPSPAGERLYLSLKDGALLALAIQTGAPIWTTKLTKPGNGVLAIGDRLYLGSMDDSFYCLAAKDGKVIWRWKTGADVIGTPAIDTKRIYFVSLDNVLRALDRDSGSVRWQKPLPMRPATGPLLTGWTIVVAGSAAELHAFSSEFNGQPMGDLILRSPENQEMQLAAPPHLTADTTLVLLTKGGQMQALIGSPSPSGP
jgi:outer membrane protein assembly factor BamB